ncbi:Uncharacterised protein [Candidatus Tiddalikarchaeum anstoanum]|nr:Uncharacterised protein [Candidatus Tiddalikarchaeum anstoanum]
MVFLGFYKVGYFSESGVKGPGFYTGNLHTHTIASDGNADYNTMIDEAVRLGFDFIALTDHNTISPTTILLCPLDKRILCIIGEEVTTTDGHLLAIGIKQVIPNGLSANETVSLIHEQEGLAIPAHPGGVYISAELLRTINFDAVECNLSVNPSEQETGCNNTYSKVYNSDAHNTEMLSLGANNCYLANLTWQSLKDSIKIGNCTLVSSRI